MDSNKHNHVDEYRPDIHNDANASGVLKIDKSTLKPIPNCPQGQHDWIDDDDEIGDMRALKCRRCPMGSWVRKSV